MIGPTQRISSHHPSRPGRAAAAGWVGSLLASALLMAWCGLKGGIAAEPPSLQALVAQLGSDTVVARDQASRELVERGEAALPALEQGLSHADAEVRRRSRKILETVQQSVHEANLAAFMEHPQQDVPLPGWPQFRQWVGEDAAARGLFVDMQRAEPALLRQAQSNPQRAGERVDRRCRELYQELYQAGFAMRQQVSADAIAALMFLTADNDLKATEDTVNRLQTFAYQQGFRHAMLNGPRKAALQKLFGVWLDSTAEKGEPYNQLRLALLYGVPAGLKPALKLVKAGETPADQRAYAALAVARFGGAAESAALEALLDDVRVFQQLNRDGKLYSTEVRDFALAALVHLAGENLADYELQNVTESSETLFTPSSVYFEDNASRDRALRRWAKRKSAS